MGISSRQTNFTDGVKNVELKSRDPISNSDATIDILAIADTKVDAKGSLSLRRLYDVFVSVFALLLLSPFLITASVLVRIETSGTMFDGFDCMSRNQTRFRAFGFRCTSIVKGQQVPTRVGSLLQRYGMAQMPLLINVLRGDISLKDAPLIDEFLKRRFNGIDPSSAENQTGLFLGGHRVFWIVKRLFDIAGSLLLLPILAIAAIFLLVLNPFWNRGTLFYVQDRMGRNCRPFKAIKFRSMSKVETIERGPDDPIETHRITRLGAHLRKCRLDELPQILNVLKGEMSLIGPRPDYYVHAVSFIENVSGYQERHIIRPGISGKAQVHLGYIEGAAATRKKVIEDHSYISNAGFVQEAVLVSKTIVTVLSRAGA